MSQYHNQHYTREDISAVLQKIQECVSLGRYSIAQNENREENIALIREYNLTSEKQRRILMQIVPEDFYHTLMNIKPGFEHEVLYVFCPQVVLYGVDDKEKQISIYTKFNIIDLPTGTRVIVISFHNLNRPIEYPFR